MLVVRRDMIFSHHYCRGTIHSIVWGIIVHHPWNLPLRGISNCWQTILLLCLILKSSIQNHRHIIQHIYINRWHPRKQGGSEYAFFLVHTPWANNNTRTSSSSSTTSLSSFIDINDMYLSSTLNYQNFLPHYRATSSHHLPIGHTPTPSNQCPAQIKTQEKAQHWPITTVYWLCLPCYLIRTMDWTMQWSQS